MGLLHIGRFAMETADVWTVHKLFFVVGCMNRGSLAKKQDVKVTVSHMHIDMQRSEKLSRGFLSRPCWVLVNQASEARARSTRGQFFGPSARVALGSSLSSLSLNSLALPPAKCRSMLEWRPSLGQEDRLWSRSSEQVPEKGLSQGDQHSVVKDEGYDLTSGTLLVG